MSPIREKSIIPESSLALISTSYNDYDAGQVTVTSNLTEVILEKQIQQLLVYPEKNCYIRLNANTKEIFLPALSWTPLSLLIDSFSIKSIGEGGKVYWQGWVI